MKFFKYIFLIVLFLNCRNIYSQINTPKLGLYIEDNINKSSLKLSYLNEDYLFNPTPIIKISYIKKVKLIKSKTRPYKQIQFEFNEEGTKIWEDVTEKNIGNQVGFIFENELYFIAKITSKIKSGKVSFGSDDKNFDLKTLYKKIDSLKKL